MPSYKPVPSGKGPLPDRTGAATPSNAAESAVPRDRHRAGRQSAAGTGDKLQPPDASVLESLGAAISQPMRDAAAADPVAAPQAADAEPAARPGDTATPSAVPPRRR